MYEIFGNSLFRQWRFRKPQSSQQGGSQGILRRRLIRDHRRIEPDHLKEVFHSLVVAIPNLIDCCFYHFNGAISHQIGYPAPHFCQIGGCVRPG